MYIYLFVGLLIYHFNIDKGAIMVTCSDLQFANATPPKAIMEKLLRQKNVTNESIDEGLTLVFEPIVLPIINVNSVSNTSTESTLPLDRENLSSHKHVISDKLNSTESFKPKVSTRVTVTTGANSQNRTGQRNASKPKFVDNNLSSRHPSTKNATFDQSEKSKFNRNFVSMSQYSTSIYHTNSQSLQSSYHSNHSTSYDDILVSTSALGTSIDTVPYTLSSNLVTSFISSAPGDISSSASHLYWNPISSASILSISDEIAYLSTSELNTETDINQDLLLPSKMKHPTVHERETHRRQQTSQAISSDIYPSLSQDTTPHLWFTHSLDEPSTFIIVPTKSYPDHIHSPSNSYSVNMLNSKPDSRTINEESFLQITTTPHSLTTVSSAVKNGKGMFSLYDQKSNFSVWGEVMTTQKDETESTTIQNRKRGDVMTTQKDDIESTTIQNRKRGEVMTTQKDDTESTTIQNRKRGEVMTIQTDDTVSTTIQNWKMGEVMTTQKDETESTTIQNRKREEVMTTQKDDTESTTIQNRKTIQELPDRPMRIIPIVQHKPPPRNDLDKILSKITDISINRRVTTTEKSTKDEKQGGIEEEEDVLSEDTVIIIIIGSVIGSLALVAGIVILTTCLQKRKQTQTTVTKTKDVEMNRKGIDNPLTKIETQSETSENIGITEDPTSDTASDTKVDG